MNMKKTISVLLLIFIAISLCACIKQVSNVAYDELIINLKNVGYTIEAEDVEESILLGERKWLTVDGSENISVYLYESNDEMEKDASYLSDDGFSYNNGKESAEIEWISYPHFFKSQNMIILYVGEDSEIIHVLEEIIGPQFSGKREQTPQIKEL